MTRTNWIRATAAVTLLYAIGHSAGYPWTPVKGPRESALIEGMKSVGFLAGGANRTYWDFYLGFGVAISAYLALQAIVLWQVAGLAESDWAKVKPIVASFVVAFVVNALIVWKFFFGSPIGPRSRGRRVSRCRRILQVSTKSYAMGVRFPGHR